jgi:hypothetical protein
MSATVYMQSLNILRDKYIKVALKFSASNKVIWDFTGNFTVWKKDVHIVFSL